MPSGRLRGGPSIPVPTAGSIDKILWPNGDRLGGLSHLPSVVGCPPGIIPQSYAFSTC